MHARPIGFMLVRFITSVFVILLPTTELRRQLDTLEELVARVPPLVIKEFLSNSVQQARQAQEQLNSQFSQRIQAWDKTKVCAMLQIQ